MRPCLNWRTLKLARRPRFNFKQALINGLFDHQDQARRKSGQLVLLFVVGVLVTVFLVNLLGFGVWLLIQAYAGPGCL